MYKSDDISLPLFPLNTVLYPGLLLPLQIFEDRYKAMLKKCMAETSSFGVVLIKKGPEVGESAIPHDIGTIAKIIQVQQSDNGIYYLWAVGAERFEIFEYSATKEGYLVGLISKLVEDVADPLLVTQEIKDLKALLPTYLALTAHLDETEMAEFETKLAPEPDQLSYQVAKILDIDLLRKQTILETETVKARLQFEIKVLRQEIEFLQQGITPKLHKLPWGDEVNLN